MFDLQRLGFEHEATVLAFERENRAYFTRSISDRGDAFFEDFSQHYRELLAAQAAETDAFYVLVDADQAVVGRVNLYDMADGTARVGYRVAERAAGHGAATFGVRALCRIAHDELGLRMLTAAASDDNVASQRVLAKAGFDATGPAQVGGRPGTEFRRDLSAPDGAIDAGR